MARSAHPLRLPRFVHLGKPLTRKERLALKFRHWSDMGRPTPVTADLLAGLFYTRYRFRMGGMMPMSRIDDDLRHFRTLLTTAKDWALWYIEAVFHIAGFKTFRSDMFTHEKAMRVFHVHECAMKLRVRNVAGEQSEFFTDQIGYGVVRV